MTDHELLVKARNIQATNGHAKGMMRDTMGRTCMAGSIFQAISGDANYIPPSQNDTWIRIRNLICDTVWGGGFIPHHNNHPSTTLDDVLGWFDKAIATTAPPPEDNFKCEEELVLT